MTDNHIVKVILKLDFKQEVDFSEALLDQLKTRQGGRFPEKKVEDFVSVEIMMEGGGKTTREKSGKRYKIIDAGTKNAIILDPMSLIFDFGEYRNYSDLKQLYQNTIEVLLPKIGTSIISRLGMRFINEIGRTEGGAMDWDGQICPKLIGGLGFPEDPRKLLRAMSIQEYQEDDFRVRFQYGMYNSEYPNPIARAEFVLDYDCYRQEEMQIYDIPGYMDTFHDTIKKLLKQSLEGESRARIGE